MTISTKDIRSPRSQGEAHATRREIVTGVTAAAAAVSAIHCGRSGKAGGAAAIARSAPITWRVQAHIGADTASFRAFKAFCASVGELSEGQLVFEPQPPGAIVGDVDIFEALRKGILDAASCPPHYAAEKYPELAFLTSYPLGLDRPDQWETWYYELGGLELARRMHEPHDIQFIAPIQHDLNIIHSKVPIRSFEDFRGKKLRLPGGLVADVFEAAGAKTVFMAADQIYTALSNGVVDAADFVGPAINYDLGYANIAPYVILGPASTPSIHQPCDLFSLQANMAKWKRLAKPLQNVVEYAARTYSWDHYTAVQKANTLVWPKYAEKKVEILHLASSDLEKFRKVAVPVWFDWAKRSPLAREAFASQLAYMKSPAVGYIDESMLVDASGKKLSLDT